MNDELDFLKPYLTSRQFEVIQLKYMGYNRKEIANKLVPAVTLQAVHQIMLRIKKRLEVKGILIPGTKKRRKKAPTTYTNVNLNKLMSIIDLDRQELEDYE